MHIQSYQIHNVLNVYRRQLSQGKIVSSRYSPMPTSPRDSVTLSNEGKNQAIMEKVAARVIEKITNVTAEPEATLPVQNDRPAQSRFRPQQENAFTFNTIVENNQKETRSIAIGNIKVLMSRLDELARAAVNQKSD